MEPIKMSSSEKLTALIEGLQARKIQFSAPSYGRAEVHRDWHDLFVVLEGKAKVQFGELAGNIEEISPGELRSNEMEIRHEVELAKGDILLIPAGVGHRTIVEDFYSEWVFKIPVRR